MYTFCPALMSHLMANSDGGIEQINERHKCVAALGGGVHPAAHGTSGGCIGQSGLPCGTQGSFRASPLHCAFIMTILMHWAEGRTLRYVATRAPAASMMTCVLYLCTSVERSVDTQCSPVGVGA